MVKHIGENIGDYNKFVTPSIGHGFDKGNIKTYGKPVKNLAKIIAGNIHRILERITGEGKINNKIVYEKIIEEFDSAKNVIIPEATLTKINEDVTKIFNKLNKSSVADKNYGTELRTKLEEFNKNHQPKTPTTDSKSDSPRPTKSNEKPENESRRTSTSERKSRASTSENTPVNKEIRTKEPSSAQDVKQLRSEIQGDLRVFIQNAHNVDKNLTNSLGQWVSLVGMSSSSTDNQVLNYAMNTDFSDLENDKFLETLDNTLRTVFKGLKQDNLIKLKKGLPDGLLITNEDLRKLIEEDYPALTEKLEALAPPEEESQV